MDNKRFLFVSIDALISDVAWTVAKELEMGADWDEQQKVDLVIYHQHIRSLFDMMGVCRLPWIELGWVLSRSDLYFTF